MCSELLARISAPLQPTLKFGAPRTFVLESWALGIVVPVTFGMGYWLLQPTSEYRAPWTFGMGSWAFGIYFSIGAPGTFGMEYWALVTYFRVGAPWTFGKEVRPQ